MAQIIVDGWTPKREISLRQTQNGKAYLNFQVADRHRKFIGNGQYEDDEHTWYDVTLWGKTAETASQVVGPSSRVIVVGMVREREYEQKGEKRKKLEVTATSVGVAQVGQQQAATASRDDGWG